ncbi:MAG: FAD-dependent oxidoreductase [Solirubrobacteraceae bacterium]
MSHRQTTAADLVVVGAGVAGLAAAARAAALGLHVVVVEKRTEIGGSGALSAGIVWTAPDLATFARIAPLGDSRLGAVLVEGFAAAVDGIRTLGIDVSERWSGQMGFGIAHHVDLPALLARWAADLQAAGGELQLATPADALALDEAGAVRGVHVEGAAGRRLIPAGAVLLASGGFQGDPELVAELIGSGADAIPLRAAPGSAGDGLRLGRAAGAALRDGHGTFYGHLIPDEIDAWTADRYLPLTQYQSAASIVVNLEGRRFADESRGDELTNQATLRQPQGRAVLICDERTRLDHAVGPAYPHGQPIDRFAVAAEAGARIVTARTIPELVAGVATWGVDAAALRRTLDDYRSAAAGQDVALDAALPARPVALSQPPFYALAVQPTITFPFGGLAVDADGRVLDGEARPVPGLFAAGADAGGLQGPGYVGGLVLGIVFGPRVAEVVAADLSSPPPADIDVPIGGAR